MRKFVLSAAVSAAAMLSFAGAAQAAPAQAINQQQAQLSQRIQQSERNGLLSRAEARGLRNRLAAIRMIEQRYRRGGLNQAERRDLGRRLDAVRASLRSERRDRDNRRG